MKFKIFSKNVFVFMNILLLPFIFLSADSDEGFPSRDILDTLSLGLNDTVGISMYRRYNHGSISGAYRSYIESGWNYYR